MTNNLASLITTRLRFRLGGMAQAIRRLPLGVHLLLAVNVPLGILLTVLMVFEYRNEMDHAILEKEAGLADEAIAVHQAVVHLAHEHSTTSKKSIEDFIERVCAKMQTIRSPGHAILVARGDEMIHSNGHSHLAADVDSVLLQTFRQGRSRLPWRNELLVLGGHEEGETAVVIVELATNIRRNALQEVLWRLGVFAVLALIAAAIVDAVLWQLIRKPLRRMSATVDAVARGEFGVTLDAPVGRELQILTRSFNSMSEELATDEQRRRGEMQRAREIQEHLLPNDVRIPGLFVCRHFQPAEVVAGDYYDLIPLSNSSWLLVVADVAGHGIPAAMAAMVLKALLLCVSEHSHAANDILRQVNQRLMSLLPTGMFVTALLAVWHSDTRRLVYVNAGHPPGLIWNHRSGIREMDATAVPVGVQAAGVYQTRELELAGDDRMVWFTDGLIEAFSPTGEMFGRARLQELIVRYGAMPPERLLDAILAAVRAFVGDAALNDDLTLLVIGLSRITTNGLDA